LAYSSAAHRNNNISGNTRLFSAAAAVSADGAYSNEASSDVNVKYGPAFKIGKLKINLFGAIFGMWEIFWGVVFWYPSMALYTLLQAMSSKLPGNIMQKIDPFRRMPICIAYAWGLLSFTLFGLWPKVEGRENLELLREVDENGKKGKLQSAMYVANHCSWMDIPFVCCVFGFRNCKIIAKAELGKVPILGRALRVGGHVILDRTNRRSQMAAYKGGVQCLKDGVNLVTFPEGTRSKTSRLGPFKKGAFKMAQSVGAPVVPMSIHYAHKIQPCDYAFPAKSARIGRPRAVIKIGKPISTDGKSDDALLEEVWGSIAGELPESQKPSSDTPAGV
jgi:1-acyl-sn-glycerol-3-phosphate acyltransferase